MWLISLIAMLFWSGSDLFSKAGSKQTDKYSHYKVGIAVGLIMGIHAIYSITIGGVPFAFSDIITWSGTGIKSARPRCSRPWTFAAQLPVTCCHRN